MKRDTIWQTTAGAVGIALVAFGVWVLAQGGGGGVRAAEDDPIAYIGIDMDNATNVLPSSSGPGSLGTIDRCIRVDSPLPQTITVDVYADGIPVNEEATSYNYQFNWAPDNIDVVNPITEGMLSFGYYDNNPGNNIPVATCWYGECENENLNAGNANTVTQLHSPRPSLVSPWNAAADFEANPEEQSWNGPQVITRVSLRVNVAGPQTVNLWLNGGPLAVNIVGDDEQVYTNSVGAQVDGVANPVQLAIDTDCPGAPVPVGGIAELPDVSDSSAYHYIALAAAVGAAALLALAAGAWYARRRWLN